MRADSILEEEAKLLPLSKFELIDGSDRQCFVPWFDHYHRGDDPLPLARIGAKADAKLAHLIPRTAPGAAHERAHYQEVKQYTLPSVLHHPHNIMLAFERTLARVSLRCSAKSSGHVPDPSSRHDYQT